MEMFTLCDCANQRDLRTVKAVCFLCEPDLNVIVCWIQHERAECVQLFDRVDRVEMWNYMKTWTVFGKSN